MGMCRLCCWLRLHQQRLLVTCIAVSPTYSCWQRSEQYSGTPLHVFQVANQILVRHPFNKAAEVQRKAAVEAVLKRTHAQVAEENAVSASKVSMEVWVAAKVRSWVCTISVMSAWLRSQHSSLQHVGAVKAGSPPPVSPHTHSCALLVTACLLLPSSPDPE
jgi:hypothetical protein